MHSEKKLPSTMLLETKPTDKKNFVSTFCRIHLGNTKELISKKRIGFRLSLKQTQFNFVTLLTFFPFVLGFSQFLIQKYNNQLTNYFFEKNLPTTTKLREKLNWETLTYISRDISSLEQIQSFIQNSEMTSWGCLNSNSSKQTHSIQNNLLLNFSSIKELIDFYSLKRKKINEIYFHENFLLVNNNLFFRALGQKKFITHLKIKSLHSNLKEFGLCIECFKLESVLPNTELRFSEKMYWELDELPAYLEGFLETSILNKKIIFGEPLNLTNKMKLFKQDEQFSQKTDGKLEVPSFTHKISAKNKFFRAHRFPSNLILPSLNRTFDRLLPKSEQNNLSSAPPINVTLNPVYLYLNSYYQNSLVFRKEAFHFFVEENIIPSIKNSTHQKKETHFDKGKPQAQDKLVKSFYEKLLKVEVEDNSFLEKGINLIDKNILPKEFLYSRKMSGYRYPDMLRLGIQLFTIQNNYFSAEKDTYLKIQLPSINSTAPRYSFVIPEIPLFLVQSNFQILRDFEKNENFYDAPGLLLDNSKSLDWNTTINIPGIQDEEMKKSGTIRSWFDLYFSQLNPFIKTKENFFGLYESPEYYQDKSDYKKQASWVENLPIYNNQYLKSTELSFFPNGFYIQVPVLKETDWQKIYLNVKNKKQDLMTSTSTGKPIPPLIQTQVPKITSTEKFSFKYLSLKINNSENHSLLKFYSPLFEIGHLGKLDYDFSILPFFKVSNSFQKNDTLSPRVSQYTVGPKVKNYLVESSDNLLSSSKSTSKFYGRYKKTPSIFSKQLKNNLVFYDNWESLTPASWLIVSQLSFALLIFKILKALIDNYGRELLVYLLDLVAALGILDDNLKQEIEILMGQREKGFRIILQSKKTFNDIAGIRSLLPGFSEIVWFLRNSAREFSMSKSLPRGILLVGPPGTGKTLLVQALAGEAQVPVLVLAGSSLIEPGESSALKLEILFQEARRLSPCIVFIDEIETLARKRDQVIQNPMGTDELLESINTASELGSETVLSSSLWQNGFSELKSNSHSNQLPTSQNGQFTNEIDLTKETVQYPTPRESQHEQLSLLMQFLVELDGMQGRHGVVVVGATNRLEMLDPAVLRPGRFDKIFELGLPSKEKRLEILKFYGKKLGYDFTICWNYFANRTSGFTAADLATIMNESTLKAIIKETHHTVETIEYGIDRILTSETDTISNRLPQSSATSKLRLLAEYRLLLVRLAFYQTGKIVLSSRLRYHPNVLIAYLWPRRTNVRSLQISRNLQQYFFQSARRCEIEHRILGCYAGKAAEVLFLQSFSFGKQHILPRFSSNLSNLGLEDLGFAQILISFIVQKWYFYSKKSTFQQLFVLAENFNNREFSREKLEFYDELTENIEKPFKMKIDQDENSKLVSQDYFSTAWWQKQISSELEFVEWHFFDWSRLYLPNPEETELNPEWAPPDEFYHKNNMVQSLPKQKVSLQQWKKPRVFWNDIHTITRDYQVHSSVLQNFNKALSMLDTHREVLDRLALELLSFEILRESMISELLRTFDSNKNLKDKMIEKPVKKIPISFAKNTFATKNTIFGKETKEQNQEIDRSDKNLIKIVDSSWGIHSRKKLSRWVNLETLNQ